MYPELETPQSIYPIGKVKLLLKVRIHQNHRQNHTPHRRHLRFHPNHDHRRMNERTRVGY